MRRTTRRTKGLLALPLLLLCLVGTLALVACGGSSGQGGTEQDASAPAEEATSEEEPAKATDDPVEVRVASLKGPTSIGLVSFMDKAKEGSLNNTYDFTIATAADEVLPAVIKGDVDIALLPANVASVLYNKTQGGVCAIDVNTLGVLNVVTGDEDLKAKDAVTLEDLSGRTVYMTGKGTVPEYTMQYLLAGAGLSDSVTLEFKDEPTEVVGVLSQDPSAVGVLPQPFATAATTKNDALKAVLDLTDAWDQAATDGSQMVTGVTIVRNEFLEKSPQAVMEFVEQQAASVDAANADPAAVAPLVVEAGIIDNEAIAAKAIPGCHLVCLTGDDMRSALEGYLTALHGLDPSSVGGSLPADDFYHVA